MRVSDLISLAKEYLLLGIVITICAVGLFCLGYFAVYKGACKGTKKLSAKTVILFAVLVCYLVVVAGATLLNRGSLWEMDFVEPLFYSYRDAWVHFSAAAWRNIILNICMFIPLGCLLPSLTGFFHKFYKTALAGFLLTLLIEGTQLLLKRGIFEPDDLLGNTVGTMIGYGFYALVVFLIPRLQKTSRRRAGTVIALQFPLIITVLVFCCIFTAYYAKELGNDAYTYLRKIPRDRLTVQTTAQYRTETDDLPVYRIAVLSKEDAKVLAEELFGALGESLDESRNDFYEETAVFYAQNRYSVWVDYAGGTYSLTDFETLFPEKGSNAVVEHAAREEIVHALKKYGIEIPDHAVFSEEGDGNYRFVIEQENANQEDTLLTGSLNCVLYDNGCFGTITNHFTSCEFYKEFAVISEQEAYEQICDGKFLAWGSSFDIALGECTVIYAKDSKGFYRPEYEFSCTINGKDTAIVVSAVQQ